MTKVMKVNDVLTYLKDGSTLTTVGFNVAGCCQAILNEIERSFLETGKPGNLTYLHSAGQSNSEFGTKSLAHKGLVKRIIGAHWGLCPSWEQMIVNNELEAFCMPQGQLLHLYRAMAANKPGSFSKIGIDTFIDPRIEGGKMNDLSKQCEDLIELIELHDETYLFYKSQPIDVALIRGTTADENGNVTMEEEGVLLEALAVAQATKANGGKVFVQVKSLVKRGSLHPKHIVVPGINVDGIIVAENPDVEHRQAYSDVYNPFISGDLKSPVSSIKPLPLSVRKVIGRRAAMELFPNAVINVGTGIPGDTVGSVANEEGISESLTFTMESGVIGGVSKGGLDFGVALNAEAIIEHTSQFDFYCGSGVDIAYMGLAEADRDANVNASKFGKKAAGCGGFIDITQSARKVVFCATFTAGGLEVGFDDGKLQIINEGKSKKFLNQVNQITFSGNYARNRQQAVLFVTERAVFEVRSEGLTLIEIAPGIDLEKDVLNNMAFRPLIADDLKVMDACMFTDAPMGLADRFYSKSERGEAAL